MSFKILPFKQLIDNFYAFAKKTMQNHDAVTIDAATKKEVYDFYKLPEERQVDLDLMENKLNEIRAANLPDEVKAILWSGFMAKFYKTQWQDAGMFQKARLYYGSNFFNDIKPAIGEVNSDDKNTRNILEKDDQRRLIAAYDMHEKLGQYDLSLIEETIKILKASNLADELKLKIYNDTIMHVFHSLLKDEEMYESIRLHFGNDFLKTLNSDVEQTKRVPVYEKGEYQDSDAFIWFQRAVQNTKESVEALVKDNNQQLKFDMQVAMLNAEFLKLAHIRQRESDQRFDGTKVEEQKIFADKEEFNKRRKWDDDRLHSHMNKAQKKEHLTMATLNAEVAEFVAGRTNDPQIPKALGRNRAVSSVEIGKSGNFVESVREVQRNRFKKVHKDIEREAHETLKHVETTVASNSYIKKMFEAEKRRKENRAALDAELSSLNVAIPVELKKVETRVAPTVKPLQPGVRKQDQAEIVKSINADIEHFKLSRLKDHTQSRESNVTAWDLYREASNVTHEEFLERDSKLYNVHHEMEAIRARQLGQVMAAQENKDKLNGVIERRTSSVLNAHSTFKAAIPEIQARRLPEEDDLEASQELTESIFNAPRPAGM